MNIRKILLRSLLLAAMLLLLLINWNINAPYLASFSSHGLHSSPDLNSFFNNWLHLAAATAATLVLIIYISRILTICFLWVVPRWQQSVEQITRLLWHIINLPLWLIYIGHVLFLLLLFASLLLDHTYWLTYSHQWQDFVFLVPVGVTGFTAYFFLSMKPSALIA